MYMVSNLVLMKVYRFTNQQLTHNLKGFYFTHSSLDTDVSVLLYYCKHAKAKIRPIGLEPQSGQTRWSNDQGKRAGATIRVNGATISANEL